VADCCVFCGKELKRFEKVELACAGVAQLACKDCWNKYKDVPKIGQYRAMLSAGWAAEPEKLRAILAELEQEEVEAEKLNKLMSCCGQPMTPLGVSEYQLGRTGWIMGDLPNLLAGSMELALFRCERCGQIKFMDPKIMKDRMKEL
jgi:hypothetical protein